MGDPAKTPARRVGGPASGMPARGYSWPPFERGNTAARTHSFYATKFQPVEREEIASTAALLREVLPLYSPSFEPTIQLLAARLWRIRRAYEFIESRPEDEVPRALLVNLGTLENTVSRDFEALGLSPRSAAALGIDLARLARASDEPFDWNALSRDERETLSSLLEKGKTNA